MKGSLNSRLEDIRGFDLHTGRVLAGKYEVLDHLGAGWESEVYLVRELSTKIERAAKIFFPQRNLGNRTSTYHARKLHKLRQCPILIQYLTQETFRFRRVPVTFLVSDYVEGEPLSRFLREQPRRRLDAFQGLHLLHALAGGVACIHRLGDYHGDLHLDNVIIYRSGLGFHVKLLDMFKWAAPRQENIQEDVYDLIRIFYDVLGGQKHYARQPVEVKHICRGLKRSLIRRQFRNAGQLQTYLENMRWDSH